MTIKEKNDLATLIDHVRRDISFREGGTFCDGEDFDKKEVAVAERAIATIKRLIMQS